MTQGNMQFGLQNNAGFDGTSLTADSQNGTLSVLNFSKAITGEGAITGITIKHDGVHGGCTEGGVADAGVSGSGGGRDSNGVIGEANNGPSAYGVWGKSTSGFAGAFNGNVKVTGTLSKGGGGFRIDHPLEPERKYLSHSFVESPDMLNVYNDNVTTDATGEATVTLPAYFEALNQDFRYQLTVLGRFAQAIVAREIRNNQFTIKTDQPHVKVSWQVTGVRQDPFANRHRILAEEDKPAAERGMYLHPEAYGRPDTQSIEHALGKVRQSP
jgi:hypothetical protein